MTSSAPISSSTEQKAGSVALLAIAMVVASYLHSAIVLLNYTFIVIDGVVLIVIVWIAIAPYISSGDISSIAGDISSLTGASQQTAQNDITVVVSYLDKIDQAIGKYPALGQILLGLIQSHLNPADSKLQVKTDDIAKRISKLIEDVKQAGLLASGTYAPVTPPHNPTTDTSAGNSPDSVIGTTTSDPQPKS